MSPILRDFALTICGVLLALTGTGAVLWRQRHVLRDLRYRATHDALTGLANRLAMYDQFTYLVRHGYPVGVIMIDLDRFKAVNDTIGHRGGDDLLRQIGRLLNAFPTPVRLAARLGGDEFVLIVDGSTDATARVAHDVWRLITGAPFNVGPDSVTVGASIGFATSRPGLSPGHLLHHADIAMYHAKHDGGGVSAHAPANSDGDLPDRPLRRLRDRQDSQATLPAAAQRMGQEFNGSQGPLSDLTCGAADGVILVLAIAGLRDDAVTVLLGHAVDDLDTNAHWDVLNAHDPTPTDEHRLDTGRQQRAAANLYIDSLVSNWRADHPHPVGGSDGS